ncbi:MAG: DsrH/TusB family sulfur metabolism protein [Pseudomonadota bacterium]
MIEQHPPLSLHLVFSQRGLDNCLNALGERATEATLLLIQDAVYAATDPAPRLDHCLALAEDLELRGISDQVRPAVRIIDRGTFVDLTARYSPIVSWS